MKRSQELSHAAHSQKRTRMLPPSVDESAEVARKDMPLVADEDAGASSRVVADDLSGAADEHKDRDYSDDEGDGNGDSDGDGDEHREELESHDDEDTESDDDVAAVADDSVHDAGIITRIEIENFMCHTNFGISLIPNVNFVTGRNGSGKSAILAALQLCLGARAGDTHRGKSLKDLIRQGHTGSAFLRVTLRNGGSEAYRPDLYGEQLTVERVINRSGGGSYNLKSARGKVVSRRKADLVEMLDHLNIQVDNPCCVLGQTDAKDFLNAASKKEGGDLYRFFLRATDLERLKRKHQEQKEGKGSMEQKLEAAKPMLVQWDEKLEKAQKAWEDCASLDTLEQQLVEHKVCFVWAELEEKEHEVTLREKQKAKEQERVDILKGKLDANVAEREANSEKQSAVTAKLEAISKRVRAIENERKALQKKVQQVRAPLEAAQLTKQRATSQIHKLSSVLRAREKKLQTLREAAKRDAEKKDVERIERRERAEHVLKAAQERLRKLNTAEIADVETADRLREELDNLRRQEHMAQQGLSMSRQELLRLRSENTDQLGKYGTHIPKLMRLIEEHESEFECKPLLIGPALQLLDEYRSWARTIEYVLGAAPRSVLVTSHADKAQLNRLRRAAGCIKGEGEAIILRHSKQRYSINQVEPRTLLTVERALQVDNPWVYNALVDTKNIESHVLFETRQECLQTIIIGDGRNARMPRFVRSGVMKNCSRMLARAGNTVDYPAPRDFPLRGYFGASETVEARISAEERRCAQHQDSLRQFAADKSERERQLKKLEGAQRQHDTQLHKAQAEVRKASDALRSTTELNVDDDEMANVEEMEELQARIETARQDIQDAQHEEAQSQADVTRLQTQLDPLEQEQHAQQDDTSIQDESMECEDKLEALVKEAKEISIKHAEYDRKLRHYQEKVKELTEDLKLNRAEVRAQLEKAEQFTLKTRACDERAGGEAEDDVSTVERVDTRGKSKDQIHEAIVKCMKRIDREKQRRGVVDAAEIKRQLEMTEKQVARRKRNIEKIKADIDRLKKGMKARRGKYTDFRKHIGKVTESLFRRNVLNRKLYGRLKFDHKTRSLTMDVTKAGADASSQISNVAMLSGGERSFTTASFLLALWQSIECPFRVLDEFDVYMDQINRQSSLLMLKNMALKEKSNNQFIFITPNSVSGITSGQQVRIHRLDDPRDTSGMHQTTLVGASSS